MVEQKSKGPKKALVAGTFRTRYSSRSASSSVEDFGRDFKHYTMVERFPLFHNATAPTVQRQEEEASGMSRTSALIGDNNLNVWI